jgi:hypothetical protein
LGTLGEDRGSKKKADETTGLIDWFYGAAIVVFAGAVLYGLYKISVMVISSDSQILHGASVACVTVFGSIASVMVANHFQARMQIRRDQHDKKAEAYEEFHRIWKDAFQASGDPKKNALKLKGRMQDSYFDIMCWGGDSVIKKYSEFSVEIKDQEREKPGGTMLLFGEMILEIRNDLGHKNSTLRSADLIKIFVNDFSKILEA